MKNVKLETKRGSNKLHPNQTFVYQKPFPSQPLVPRFLLTKLFLFNHLKFKSMNVELSTLPLYCKKTRYQIKTVCLEKFDVLFNFDNAKCFFLLKSNTDNLKLASNLKCFITANYCKRSDLAI